MDWSSCRFRFHGWFLFGLWKQTTGGRIPLFHPNTPKTQKDQTAFLQNRVMAMVGWNQPQKDVHFSKRGEHSNRIQSTPWKTSQRYCSVYLNLHKAYSWKDNSLGWSPTLDAGLNESLLHIPYSKRTRWMETGMEMKRFWQVQDLAAPLCGETCHRYVFWRLEIWTILEDLMGRTMGSDASKDHQLGEYPWACPPSSDHKYHHNHHLPLVFCIALYCRSDSSWTFNDPDSSIPRFPHPAAMTGSHSATPHC